MTILVLSTSTFAKLGLAGRIVLFGLVTTALLMACGGIGVSQPTQPPTNSLTSSSEQEYVTPTVPSATPTPEREHATSTVSGAAPSLEQEHTKYGQLIAQLNNPRGIAIASDGTIFVADSGGPEREYSGAITRVGVQGVDQLPFARFGNFRGEANNREYLFGLSDVAVYDEHQLYVAMGIHAWMESPLYAPNRVMGLALDGTLTDVFDAGRFEKERDPDGQGPDSNLTSIAITKQGSLWVSDAAGNWVAHVSENGEVLSVVAFPEVDQEEAVPTGITIGPDGLAYVALFHCRTPTENKGGVARINPDGTFDIVVSGLSNPIDVAFDSAGRLHVLEFAVDFAPNTGRLTRVTEQGDIITELADLRFPTSFAIDGQGVAYITAINAPNGGAVGTGTLVEVPLQK